MKHSRRTPAIGFSTSEITTVQMQPIPPGARVVTLIAVGTDENTLPAPVERRKRVPNLEVKFPTEKAILALPKCVVLAFSARCARRLLPLISDIKSRRDDVSVANLAFRAVRYLETGKDQQLTQKYTADMPLTSQEFHPENNLFTMADYLQNLDRKFDLPDKLAERLRHACFFIGKTLHLQIFINEFNTEVHLLMKSISEAKQVLRASLDSLDYSLSYEREDESLNAASKLESLLKQFREFYLSHNTILLTYNSELCTIIYTTKNIFSGLASSPSELTPYCEDFARIVRLSAKYAWTDETRVPPEVFGRLWPYGEPDWAKTRHDDTEETA